LEEREAMIEVRKENAEGSQSSRSQDGSGRDRPVGDPVWHGGPSQKAIALIRALTDYDEKTGILYERLGQEEVRPVRTLQEYALLNERLAAIKVSLNAA
jgi:hypothetical protein